MPFTQELVLDTRDEQVYGKYVISFHSQNGQILAHLFDQNGRLVAHVAAVGKMDIVAVTDTYVAEMNQYAREHGYQEQVQIIYH